MVIKGLKSGKLKLCFVSSLPVFRVASVIRFIFATVSVDFCIGRAVLATY